MEVAPRTKESVVGACDPIQQPGPLEPHVQIIPKEKARRGPWKWWSFQIIWLEKKTIYDSREPNQFPILLPFPCDLKKATALLDR